MKRDFDTMVEDIKSRMKRDKPLLVIKDHKGESIDIAMKDKGNEWAHTLGGFKRHKSKGDGNCAFRSYSQSIAGHQNLHIPIRQGTAAWMRSHPEHYNRDNMSIKNFNKYISQTVEKVNTPINNVVEQAAADLLRARITHIYATSSRVISQVTPRDGEIYYEINIGNIPKHADTLGRDHLYKYHLED